jgi:putative membrane protein insertion efficiency factor
MRALLVAVITVYRRAVSPFLPLACRFYPSCSAYAAEAVRRHGALRGSLLSVKRLARCHPLCEGGIDPVP